MRIRVMPREVFLGIESKSDGIHQFSIGVLADHISSGDGVVLYTPNDDFSQCAVFAVAEVVDVDLNKDSCSLNVRNHSSLIRPDSKGRHKWRKNRYLCLDKKKLTKYELMNLFVQAFNDDTWVKRAIQDDSKKYAKFDLSKRTLLPKSGYVYLFKSRDAYKIGMSEDTARRKNEIAKGKKLDLELLHRFLSNDMERAEATLHRDFAHCRHKKTEFFDLSMADVDRILAIPKMDFPLP